MHLLQNILLIDEKHNIQGGSILIYIDNISLINHSNLPQQGSGPTKFLQDDIDILMAIQYLHRKLTKIRQIVLQHHHIFRHLESKAKQQENLNKHGKETLQTRLQNNKARTLKTICDQEAEKSHHCNITQPHPAHPHQIMATFYNTNITTNNMQNIQDLHFENDYK